jgi:hypothetical protein
LALAVGEGVGVAPADLAGAWERDEEARSVGSPMIEPVPPGTFLPGLAELVVIPLVVNLASSVVYDLVKRLVMSLRPPEAPGAVEVVVRDVPDGGRLVVVRVEGSVR